MNDNSHHIIPLKYYIFTLCSLLILTFVTVFVAQFDFGVMNVPIALFIAVVKASLVIGFFMGLHFDRGFVAFFFLSSLFVIFLFFLFIFSDIVFRGATEPYEREIFDLKTPVRLIETSHDVESLHH